MSTARDRMETAVEALPDPFVVLDRELQIDYANAAAVRLARQQLVGQPAHSVPFLRDAEREVAQVSSQRVSTSLEAYLPEHDRWFECTLSPLHDGISILARDVTVKKHGVELAARLASHALLRADVSAALAEQKELRPILQAVCEALVEHLDVAFARVWTADETSTNLLLQASAGIYTHIDGGHASVPIGKFKIGRIASYRKPHLTNDVQHDPQVGDREWAKREGMVAFAGYPLLVDGNLIGVLAMFARHRLFEDTLSALGGIADTVAQGIVRRRTEQELEHRVADLARSNSDLEQFAYIASHDLQEPLRMVTSYTQLLARRYKGQLGPDADEFIGFAVEGTARMQRLINDLLAYSRVGNRTAQRAEVELDRVAKDVVSNLEAAIKDAHAEVVVDPLPKVFGDAAQLGQVLQNLISNAIKFYREGVAPRVHVTAERVGAFWRIAVQDNGIGIDPQYFERIFVIFQRLNPREKYPGTGMGLAICKKVVESHGGTIGVTSTLDAGSCITFTLPARGLK